MVLRFYDFQKFEIEGLTPLSVWVAVVQSYFAGSHQRMLEYSPKMTL